MRIKLTAWDNMLTVLVSYSRLASPHGVTALRARRDHLVMIFPAWIMFMYFRNAIFFVLGTIPQV
jgi:hypothetical protein